MTLLGCFEETLTRDGNSTCRLGALSIFFLETNLHLSLNYGDVTLYLKDEDENKWKTSHSLPNQLKDWNFLVRQIVLFS